MFRKLVALVRQRIRIPRSPHFAHFGAMPHLRSAVPAVWRRRRTGFLRCALTLCGMLAFVLGSPTFAAKKTKAEVPEKVSVPDGGDQELQFGKYSGRPFSAILEEDRDYCRWILDVAETADASPTLSRFADWLVAAAPELEDADDEEVTFGKHKGQSFAQVLKDDPDYCSWVLGACQEKDVAGALKRLGKFIKKNGEGIGIKKIDTVGFGKYRGMTFQEVKDADPSYCEWVVTKADDPSASSGIKNLAAFIKKERE
ncbi:unnamed protein product [Polarella glacialis]|uniref:Exodeoxyribonuclease X-like C-terminal domain-containing protein n=1 Tax=Polarella glacialis TaxID=89957 RepID=A0A813ERG1_POLGL|nr:unnamed protein product [Polarella glacialis]